MTLYISAAVIWQDVFITLFVCVIVSSLHVTRGVLINYQAHDVARSIIRLYPICILHTQRHHLHHLVFAVPGQA